MSEADLLRLAEDRKLIFANVMNGVPINQIMVAFRRSESEVNREVNFVARKIREYRFRRLIPPLDMDTHNSIRQNRAALAETLDLLGPQYLSSEFILPTIGVQSLDTYGDVREAAQRAGARVNE